MTQEEDPDEKSGDASPIPPRFGDAALVLPLIALALFSPPLIGLFARDAVVFGAPVIVAYVFVVWIALIIAARAISLKLSKIRED